ncbi:MAG: hypothetical protein NTY11_02610 [Candidatus Parcubacteria bacterium]|nr:hypothetical protein [Candidatus Parcubacteria bacterium]
MMSKINDRIINRTIGAVANFYNISPGDIIGKSRLKSIVWPRFIAVYILREEYHGSFPIIANKIGGRDHTTTMYAHKKIVDAIQKDLFLRDEIDGIRAVIRGEKKHIEKDENYVINREKAKKKRESKKINPILSDKEKHILTEWRFGRTLENISQEWDVTRERIRQIKDKAISKEIIGKQLEGFEIDINEFLKRERNSHITIRKSKSISHKNEGKLVRKNKRWSRYYDRCRKCGTTIIPHRANGFCDECSPGVRNKRRVNLILRAGNKCSLCGLGQDESFRTLGRDLYVVRDTDSPRNYIVMCRKCFLTRAGKKMGEGHGNSRGKF